MIDISRKLDKYVKLSKEERKKRRKWLTRQSEELELEAFLRQKKHYFKLSKHKNDKNVHVLYFAAYTLAASEIYEQMNSEKGKNKSNELNDIIDNTELKAKNIKKVVPRMTWDGMLNRKYTIMKLHYLGVSTRKISEEIEDLKNNFSASHMSISSFIKQMKEE